MVAYLIILHCFACLLTLSQQACNRENRTPQRIPYIDDNTDEKFCTIEINERTLDLVFSDEFESPRNIAYADNDSKWHSNNLAFLNKEFCTQEDAVTIQEGHLRLEVKAQKASCHDPLAKLSNADSTRNSSYISGSAETWNKFCFTGGYVEVAFQLSKNYHKYAELFVQLYGNLFRLGRFDKIYEYFVGWDYNTCKASNSNDIKKWGGTFEQHLSACPDDPDAKTYGLKAGVGRGAQNTIIGQIKPIADHPDNLMGIDHAAGVRPVSPPEIQYDLVNLEHKGVWYNPDFVGPIEIEDRSDPRWRLSYLSLSDTQDVYKAVGLHNIPPKEVQVVGIEWEPEEYLKWYVNGELMFEVDKSALAAYEYDGVSIGERLISREASYINLFLDAQNLPEDPEEFEGEAYVDVDYVRVYQKGHASKEELTCNPPSLPTKPIIDVLEEDYYYPHEIKINNSKVAENEANETGDMQEEAEVEIIRGLPSDDASLLDELSQSEGNQGANDVEEDGGDGGLSATLIVVIVIAVLLTILIVVVSWFVVYMQRANNQIITSASQPQMEPIPSDLEGNLHKPGKDCEM